VRRFQLTIEANGGALWLHLTGPAGAKAILHDALHGQPSAESAKHFHTAGDVLLDEQVAQALAQIAANR
jgi:hypothetical protein